MNSPWMSIDCWENRISEIKGDLGGSTLPFARSTAHPQGHADVVALMGYLTWLDKMKDKQEGTPLNSESEGER